MGPPTNPGERTLRSGGTPPTPHKLDDVRSRDLHAHIHWLVEHLDADLVLWHARRRYPLVVIGRLDARDRTWAQVEHRMAAARALLDELGTQAADPTQRAVIRCLAARLARLDDHTQALVSHLRDPDDQLMSHRRSMALREDLSSARDELSAGMISFGTVLGLPSAPEESWIDRAH